MRRRTYCPSWDPCFAVHLPNFLELNKLSKLRRCHDLHWPLWRWLNFHGELLVSVMKKSLDAKSGFYSILKNCSRFFKLLFVNIASLLHIFSWYYVDVPEIRLRINWILWVKHLHWKTNINHIVIETFLKIQK